MRSVCAEEVAQLTGAAARDWFFANLTGSGAHDKITDLKNGELAEELIFVTDNKAGTNIQQLAITERSQEISTVKSASPGPVNPRKRGPLTCAHGLRATLDGIFVVPQTEPTCRR